MHTHLADFLAPLPAESVIDRDTRKALQLHFGTSDNGAAHLASWEDLLSIATGIQKPADIEVTVNRRRVPFEFLQKDGAVDRATIEKLLRRGASVIAPNAQRYDDRLAAIAREFLTASETETWLGIIGSTGEIGALSRHSDPVDLFLLQVEGTKHWRVFGPDKTAETPIFEHTLKPGEYLFLPAGYEHECDTPGGSSLHLGMGFAAHNYTTFV